MPIDINQLLSRLQSIQSRKTTLKPDVEIPFSIMSEGQLVPDAYELIQLEINHELNQIPFARLVFRTRLKPGSTADEIFYPGQRIRISGGYEKNFQELFEGKVVKFKIESSKGPRRIVLEIQHDAIVLKKGKKNQSFQQMKDSEIWESILSAHRLAWTAHPSNFTHPEMIQFNCTDWDFLLARAEANGRLVRMTGNRVEIFTPNPNQEAALSLNNESIVRDFDLELDSLGQVSEVAGVTWDASNQKIREENSEEGNWDTSGKLSGKELAEVVESGKTTLAHGGDRASEELKSQADNYLMRSRLSKVRGTFKIFGYPFDKNLGDYLLISGWGAAFDGKALISGFSHHFTLAQGWSTQITIGLPDSTLADQSCICTGETGTRFLPPVQGLQIGKVTRLENDPAGAFRVAVRIPILGNQDQEIWARIAHPDAGDQRGMIFYPEIGDEVVLGFLNEDPRDAIILGSLNSIAKPSPFVPQDDNIQKGIVTRSGMQLVFDEDEKSIEIKTPSGNLISVNESEKKILMSDQSGNRVQLDQTGIELHSSKSIHITSNGDVEIQGINIELKATATLKAEGSATAELSSSGVTKVKGSLVQIN